MLLNLVSGYFLGDFLFWGSDHEWILEYLKVSLQETIFWSTNGINPQVFPSLNERKQDNLCGRPSGQLGEVAPSRVYKNGEAVHRLQQKQNY